MKFKFFLQTWLPVLGGMLLCSCGSPHLPPTGKLPEPAPSIASQSIPRNLPKSGSGGITLTPPPKVPTAPGKKATPPPKIPTAPGKETTPPPKIPTAPGKEATPPPKVPTAPGKEATPPPKVPTAPGKTRGKTLTPPPKIPTPPPKIPTPPKGSSSPQNLLAETFRIIGGKTTPPAKTPTLPAGSGDTSQPSSDQGVKLITQTDRQPDKVVMAPRARPSKLLPPRNRELDPELLKEGNFTSLSSEFKFLKKKQYQKARRLCAGIITDASRSLAVREEASRMIVLLPVKYWGDLRNTLKGTLVYIGPPEGSAKVQTLKIKTDFGNIEKIPTVLYGSRVENELALGEEVLIKIYDLDFTLIKRFQAHSPQDVRAAAQADFSITKSRNVILPRNRELDPEMIKAEYFQLISPQFTLLKQQKYRAVRQNCISIITNPKNPLPVQEAARRMISLLPEEYWGDINKVIRGKLISVTPLLGTAREQTLKIKSDSGRNEKITTTVYESRVKNEIHQGDEVLVKIYELDFMIIKKAGQEIRN